MSANDEVIIDDVDWSGIDLLATMPEPPSLRPTASGSLPVRTSEDNTTRIIESTSVSPAPPPLPVISRAIPPTVPSTSSTSEQQTVPTPTVPSAPLVRGQRVDLANLGLSHGPFAVGLKVASGPTMDLVGLGLGAQDKLIDESYVIFFNQTVSPCGSIKIISRNPGEYILQINPSTLPSTVSRILIAVAIDGGGDLLSVGHCNLKVGCDGKPGGQFAFSGSEIGSSKGIILAELYLRQGTWRLFVRCEGFSGGLEFLLRQHGVVPT